MSAGFARSWSRWSSAARMSPGERLESMGKLFYVFAALFCLVLSFILSGMEAGVLALSRLRIRQQSRAGRYAAQVLHGYLENPENFLWTILIGNTLATFTVFSMLVVALYRVSDQQPLF